MKDNPRPIPSPSSLAVNRWLSPVTDSGPWGANWSHLWPLTLMEGVVGGQTCKGYPLYPSSRTAAQSSGRHPARIQGSLGTPTTSITFIWSIWAKEQTPPLFCDASTQTFPKGSLLFLSVDYVLMNSQQILHRKDTVKHCSSCSLFSLPQLNDRGQFSCKDWADPSLTQRLVRDFQRRGLCKATFFEVSTEVSTIALSLLVFLRAPFHHKPHTCTATHTHSFSNTPSFKLKYCL